jgi:hypothetical protein
MFLQNVRICQQVRAAIQPRRPSLTYSSVFLRANPLKHFALSKQFENHGSTEVTDCKYWLFWKRHFTTFRVCAYGLTMYCVYRQRTLKKTVTGWNDRRGVWDKTYTAKINTPKSKTAGPNVNSMHEAWNKILYVRVASKPKSEPKLCRGH